MKKQNDTKQPGKQNPKDQYTNKLTTADLKGKKVDAFPDTEQDKPLNQKAKTEKK